MSTERKRMRQLSATTAEWTAANPTLLSGEVGFDTTAKDFKVGPGAWTDLPYYIGDSILGKFLPITGGTLTGPVVFNTGQLQQLQFRARALDNITDVSFRNNAGDTAWRWDIRATASQTGGLQFRHNDVVLGQFASTGNLSLAGTSGALITGPGGVVSNAEVQSRSDANPSFGFRSAAGTLGALMYLNRANANADRPGLISWNLYNPDGSAARVVGSLPDVISRGGTLGSLFTIVTREHGDARYGQLAVSNAWAGDQFVAGRLRSSGIAQERGRFVQTTSLRGLELFASNLTDPAAALAYSGIVPVVADVSDFNNAIAYYSGPAGSEGWYIGARLPANKILTGSAVASQPSMIARSSITYNLGELWQNAVAGITWPAMVSFVGGNNSGAPSIFVVEISGDGSNWFRVGGGHTNSDNNQWGGSALVPPNWFVRARRESGANTASVTRVIQY